MYKNAKKVPFFHTCTTSQVFEITKSDLSKYSNNILSNYQKKGWCKNIEKHQSFKSSTDRRYNPDIENYRKISDNEFINFMLTQYLK